MKILVVEDDPHARKALRLILKLDGFDVSTAATGQEAIQVLQADIPDLIVLDVILPEMDGYEVCRRVRANPSTAHVPIVMLSGRADPDSVARGLATGADGFLAKPIKPSKLTKSLRSISLRDAMKTTA